jgi:hypothetical protein
MIVVYEGALRMLSDPLAKAKHFHNQAEGIEALVPLEASKQRKKVMAEIAELYYLLHDALVEFSREPSSDHHRIA